MQNDNKNDKLDMQLMTIFDHFKRHFVLYLGVFILFPILILSLLNQPCADDFSYALEVKRRGFFLAQEFWYLSWTGRYFATAIISIFVSSEILLFISCQIVPIFLFCSFILSINILFKTFFAKSLSRRETFSLVIIFVFIYIYNLPSVSHGLFWLTGIITYLLPSILFLLFLSGLIKTSNTSEFQYKRVLILILLVISIIGSLEIFCIPMFFIILLFIGYDWIYKKTINLNYLLILIAIILFGLASILAPGNYAREASSAITNPYPTSIEGRHNFLLSFINTLKELITLLSKWLTNPILAVISIFFINFVRKKAILIKWKILSIHPIIASLLFLFFLSIIIFPSFWLTNYFVDRLRNIVYFFFLLGWFTMLLVFVRFFTKNNLVIRSLPRYGIIILMFLILINLNSPNSFRYMYVDIIKGSAFRYNKEIKNRNELIKTCNDSVCLLPAIKNKPISIYFGDLSTDSNNWVNDCMSNYYGKRLILKKQ